MLYITNAISLNMVDFDGSFSFTKATEEMARTVVYGAIRFGNEVVNAIGHKDMADIVRGLLNDAIPEGERISVNLSDGDIVLVAQYKGPRLPEGTTRLPEDATIEWYIVRVSEN